MSDIKAGDLVVVVKPTACCQNKELIGVIFRVSQIIFNESRCNHCLKMFKKDVMVSGYSVNLAFEMPRLKKIPPLSELEGKRSQEDIGVFNVVTIDGVRQ